MMPATTLERTLVAPTELDDRAIFARDGGVAVTVYVISGTRPEADPTRPVSTVADEDDLAHATWEDAEWQ